MEEFGLEVLQKLIDFVESAAPHLWEIAQRQVIVSIADNAFWAVVVIIAIAAAVYAAKRLYQYHNRKESGDRHYDGWAEIPAIFLYIASFLLLIVLPFLVSNIISMLLNPSFYAIRVLVEFIR